MPSSTTGIVELFGSTEDTPGARCKTIGKAKADTTKPVTNCIEVLKVSKS